MEGGDPESSWRALVRDAAAQDTGVFGDATCEGLAELMRKRRLTFGGRLLCPFLRPFFLTKDDERRVTRAAQALWRLGEQLARGIAGDPARLEALGLSDAEIALVTIDPGPGPASTAARADAFLLPNSLQFAEYNAESPAGAAYSQRLSELFDEQPIMAMFKKQFDVWHYEPVDQLLASLMLTYREWGGTDRAPRTAIVDWRDVPTFSEFELLRDAFVAEGVPTVIHDPRDLEFDGRTLSAAGERIDFVYRRVLINDILARPDECRALVDAYRARAVCVANSFRCKIPHKKAFFAALTDDKWASLFDPDGLAAIAPHVPWTRIVTEALADDIRRRREQLVLKPNDEYGGKGVTLGWETREREWDDAIQRAVKDRSDGAHWIVQERINVRREVFPVCDSDGIVERDMLVGFAPYLFRGNVAGFLTRLSATGLANVTSGGGQVPAFVVEARRT